MAAVLARAADELSALAVYCDRTGRPTAARGYEADAAQLRALADAAAQVSPPVPLHGPGHTATHVLAFPTRAARDAAERLLCLLAGTEQGGALAAGDGGRE